VNDTVHVIDVNDANFEDVVIEGSKQRPVVVDLWADWCGPCKTLGPMLEKVAGERAGAFTLAKVDVDHTQVGQELLAALRSQSIPTVVAFREGQPVNGFVGLIAEEDINAFVDSVLPSEAEIVAEEAGSEAEAGDLEGAEEGFREALQKDAQNRDAAVGLARILVDRGDIDEAKALAGPHLPDPEAEQILARATLIDWGRAPGQDALAPARSAAAAGETREALESMTGFLNTDRDAAREAMVTVFTAIGDDDPLVSEYRRRLASALF
jgi:putative thioredoxin